MNAMKDELKKRKAPNNVNISHETQLVITHISPQLIPMLLSHAGDLLYEDGYSKANLVPFDRYQWLAIVLLIGLRVFEIVRLKPMEKLSD